MKKQPEDILSVLQKWVNKAEQDLMTAKHMVSLADAPYDTVCFHAQQCAEKYIKALLVQLQIEFSKTHDIKGLLQLLPPQYSFQLNAKEAEKLTYYAIAGRYPVDNMDDLSKLDADEAVTLANRVKESVRLYLNV